MNIVFTATKNSVVYHSDNNKNNELRKVSETYTDKPLVLIGEAIARLNVQLVRAVVSIIAVDLDASKN